MNSVVENRRPNVLGAVLAGGRSRRFGSDKATASLDGRTLIEHAITSLRGHVATVVICGRTMAAIPSLSDRPAPDQGPLGGLNAALHYASARNFAGVVTIGCDMPLLEPDLVDRLVGEEAAIVKHHHLIGYWPAALSEPLDEYLASREDRSMRSWIAETSPRVIVLRGQDLPNINTKTDLARLREQWLATK